ncbi:putative RNA-directed DNA polymerase [Tanacetum coccineum]
MTVESGQPIMNPTRVEVLTWLLHKRAVAAATKTNSGTFKASVIYPNKDGKIKIDKFDGHDFGFWKMQIEDYLYPKKLHEPLAEAKPTGMKAEDWTLLDRQALGAVRLSLAKNVAYNTLSKRIPNKRLVLMPLTNMYEKPNASNKVFPLFDSLVNSEDKGMSPPLQNDHENEFNSILSRLMSVDIKFDDEVTKPTVTLFVCNESLYIHCYSISMAESKDKGQKQNRSKRYQRRELSLRTSRITLECNQKGRFSELVFDKKLVNLPGIRSVHMAVRDYDDALVCCVENTIDDRIMDSGASFHATYCKEELERFKLRSSKVRLADDKTLDIAGVGDVVLKTSFGTSWTLKDVSLVVARGNKRGSMYMVEVPSDGINATIDGRVNAALWHQRLGHMSEKGMKILASKGRIPDLKKAVVGFCEPCVLGKQKKVSFIKSGNTRKLQRLELVHTDVYGPTSVASIGGSHYYVTFIDDSSRKVWVYFLKNKFEVFNTFKKWKAAMENETNLRVKCLKSDNGGEYNSREFIEYCAENEIRMLKTILETPQQNGVAERMNRTLNERAKRFRILEEEWQGNEVSLAHLRVFGCDSYVKVKDAARDKLDSKFVKCTFIGYGSDEMGYRFWDSKSHKVIQIRDVTFNEDSLYGAKVATDSSNLMKPNQKDQVVLEDSPENLANKSIVIEHGLSSEITQCIGYKCGYLLKRRKVLVLPDCYTQSPGGSSDTSEGSENSGSFKDSGRSDEEDSKYKASSEEGGFETLQLQRSTKESRAPVMYSPSASYLLLTENGEPESYSESLSSKEFVQWNKAINEEMVSLEKNQTWSLVRLSAGKKALQSKWVFKVKEEHDGKKRYKDRLVVKGFQHKQGVHYNEIFSPVVKMTTIRLVLSIVAAENLHLEQLDVKTTFLHGDLDEDIYMTQPEGFYFMQRAGYKRCAMDHCFYLKKVGSSSIILLLYVDDMLVAGSDMAEIKKLKRQLSQEFEMKDLGPAKQILGMSIIRDKTKGTLRLSQEKYKGKVLEKFNMKDAEARCQPLGDHFKLSEKQAPKTETSRRRKAKVPYASTVGSVMYAMEAVKWLLRYLKGTSKATLCFSRKEVVLEGFFDSDYAGYLDSDKSTTGYVFIVGRTTVSWMSKIQKCVDMSTTEVEYMAIAEAGKELVWLKNFLEELDKAQTECVMFCNNEYAIHLAKNPVFHGRTKHIKIRYYYIRELVSEGTLSLKKILGAKNLADMLTKVVTTKKLKLYAALTGLRDN